MVGEEQELQNPPPEETPPFTAPPHVYVPEGDEEPPEDIETAHEVDGEPGLGTAVEN